MVSPSTVDRDDGKSFAISWQTLSHQVYLSYRFQGYEGYEHFPIVMLITRRNLPYET